MENRNKVILFIVLGSVLLNVMMLSRVAIIRQDIHSVDSSIRSNIYLLENRIKNIHTGINHIKEEGKWTIVKALTPNLEKSKPGEIHLELEFSLREVDNGANVNVLYKSELEVLWNNASVASIGGNSFKSSLILENKSNYQYQIVSESNILRLSEAYPIFKWYTQPSPLEAISSGSTYGSQGVTHIFYVFAQQDPVFDFYKFKTSVAKVYKDNKLERVIEMKPVDQMYSDPHYQSEPGDVIGFESNVDQNTKIIVEVEYMDGTIHEGEIFHREEFRNKY